MHPERTAGAKAADTSTLDFNTLTLPVTIAASWLTTIIRQSNRHDNSIKALDVKFAGELRRQDTKFNDECRRRTRRDQAVLPQVSGAGEGWPGLRDT